MKKTFILHSVLLLGAMHCMQAQTILKQTGGASLKVLNGTYLRVLGSLSSDASALVNSGIVVVTGNMNASNGATYAGSGTYTLASNGAPQTLAASTLPALTINNGDLVTLANDVTVSGTLTLNNGKLFLGNHNLTVSNSIAGYSPTSYIVTNGSGGVRTSMASGDIIEVPVGNSSYNPVILLSNSGATEVFTVRVADNLASNAPSGVNRTWHISEATPGGNNIDISLEWATTDEQGSFDRTQSGLAHFNGSIWEEPVAYSAATAAGAGRWSQTLSGQTSFSPFAVINSGTFPVELTAFEGQAAVGRNLLWWTTASELNNAGFEVERSLDGGAFSAIGFVAGAGTTSTPAHYEFADNQPLATTLYYRLRQIDLDGRVQHSAVLAVQSEFSSKLVLGPNPAAAFLSLQGEPIADQEATIRASDGRIVTAWVRNNTIEVQSLPTGCYTLKLTGYPQPLRFIKQ